ncbi:hypothetical protein [Rugosimonospora africana]|uniref:hypothetical protein n=1 Tax=Rugosimonospora africana TaxID=556532 RepID=UPI0019432A8B|nr:hypothetical protein [Rugosimonospora africana]
MRLLRHRMVGRLRRWSAAVLDTGGDVAGGEAPAVAIVVTAASADSGPVGGRRLRDPVPTDPTSATSGGSATPIARPVEASTAMSPSGSVPTPGATGAPAVGGTAPDTGQDSDSDSGHHSGFDSGPRVAAGDRMIRPCAPADASVDAPYDWSGSWRDTRLAEPDRSQTLPLPAG